MDARIQSGEPAVDLKPAAGMHAQACLRCGLAFDSQRLGTCPRCLLEADLGPQRLAERYELVEELGRGAFGVVHKAHDLRTGEWVAVKLLHEHLAEDPRLIRRFSREARMLAELDHPHIVGFRGLGQEDGRTFIVMEYVDGQPLDATRSRGPRQVLALARQLCDALHYAHDRGLVHRDLKPGNVLVDPAGQVKIADFGIATWVAGPRAETRLTLAEEHPGTPAYMAPEAQRGTAPHARQDVYSLGVLLYQMLMGRLPSGFFELPPEPFGAALRGALAGEPHRRTESIAALRRALDIESPPAPLPQEEQARAWGVAGLAALAMAVTLDAAQVLVMAPQALGWAPGAGLAVVLAFLASGLVRALNARWQRLGYRGQAGERYVGSGATWTLASAVTGAALTLGHGLLGLLTATPWGGLASLLRLVALVTLMRQVLEAGRQGRSWREDWRLFASALVSTLPLLTTVAQQTHLLGLALAYRLPRAGRAR